MTEIVKLFDPHRKRQQRDRAARCFVDSAFLHQRVCDDILDRLEAINRRFTRTLVLFDGRSFAAALAKRPEMADKLGVRVHADIAEAMRPDVVIDAEVWPFGDAQFDLVLSVLHLHWTNDLPGALIQARRCLRPDGLFIGALFGDGTLSELRESFLQADSAITGGAGLRVSPFADLRDLAGLLQRAGMALPVSDTDRVTVTYENGFRLLADLRAMAETAVFMHPAPPLRRDVLAAALEHYATHFANADGRLQAQFNIVTLTGWAPDESQQKPLRPGSAKARLADALGVAEHSAGEKPDS